MIDPIISESIAIFPEPHFVSIFPLIAGTIIVFFAMGFALYIVYLESKKPWLFYPVVNNDRWNYIQEVTDDTE